MPTPKTAGRRRKRRWRSLLLLPVAALLAFLGWNYLRPLLSDETIPTYAQYTAARGDVLTSRSFSAALAVRNSETLSNSRQVTSVRKVYVQADQDVKEGDKLLQLETGEVLKAGIDGTVNEIRFQEGEWIWPNVSLIQICDLTNLQVSLSVDEYDIANVAAGEACTVTIVPLGLTFETRIDHVDRVSSAGGSVAYYAVTANLTVPENVLPGMTASVSIPSQQALDVVTLDMAALSFDADQQPYVLVQNGGAYEKRAVQTGLSDGMRVQIVSGLNEGDTVYRQTGEEKAAGSLSLIELYKQIAGETVIINDRSQTGRGARGERGEHSGMPGDIELPEGIELPKGIELPEGMEMPTGEQPPRTGGAPNEEAD